MKLTVEKFVSDLHFKVISGEKGLQREILVPKVARPGMELAGFWDYFDPKRVILIGSKEAQFLHQMDQELAYDRVKRMFSENPPAIVFSMNVKIAEEFIKWGDLYQIPIIQGDMGTNGLSSKIGGYLIDKKAPRQAIHGVLVDIHGFGTLITGPSGIGKSEIALELLKRGHTLVSDDRVDIYQKEVGVLVGEAPDLLKKYIEIRGIGIVDVVALFGIGAYRENKKIRLVVDLQKWEDEIAYDRIGANTETIQYFDTTIPKITIPVSPGRNVAILVESAALNEKLKYFGFDGSKNFENELNQYIQKNEKNQK